MYNCITINLVDFWDVDHKIKHQMSSYHISASVYDIIGSSPTSHNGVLWGLNQPPQRWSPKHNRFDGLVTICCEVDMVLNGELPSKKPSDVSKAIIKNTMILMIYTTCCFAKIKIYSNLATGTVPFTDDFPSYTHPLIYSVFSNWNPRF